MSLSRLWQQQGKKEEARRLLAEVYNWFTEGPEAKEQQEATGQTHLNRKVQHNQAARKQHLKRRDGF